MNRREFMQTLGLAAGAVAIPAAAIPVDAASEAITPVSPPPPPQRTIIEQKTGACLYAGGMGIFKCVGWVTEMQFLHEQEMINLGRDLRSGPYEDPIFMPGKKGQNIELEMLSPDLEMVNGLMCSVDEVDYRIVFKSESMLGGDQRIDFSGHLTESSCDISMDGPAMTKLKIQIFGMASWS